MMINNKIKDKYPLGHDDYKDLKLKDTSIVFTKEDKINLLKIRDFIIDILDQESNKEELLQDGHIIFNSPRVIKMLEDFVF